MCLLAEDFMKTYTNLSKMLRQIPIKRVQVGQLLRVIGISFTTSTRQFPLPSMKEDGKSGGRDCKMWNHFHTHCHEPLPLLWPYKVKLYFYNISPPFPFPFSFPFPSSPVPSLPLSFYCLHHRKRLEWPQEEKTIEIRTARFWQQRACSLG